MATVDKTLASVLRGDRIVTPRGVVTVTSFTHNWDEDFGLRGRNTVTVIGKLPNGKQVRLEAAPITTITVEVQA